MYSPVTLSQDDTDEEVDEERVAPGKLKYDRLITFLVRDGGVRGRMGELEISWVDGAQRYLVTSDGFV